MGRQDVPGRRVRCVRVGRVRRGGGGGPAYLRHPCHRLRGGTGGGQGPESHARPGTSAGRSGPGDRLGAHGGMRSEEHTSELQSRLHLVCRLLLEKKKKKEDKSSEERQIDTSDIGY